MALTIDFDTSELKQGFTRLNEAMKMQNRIALSEVAMEILRLSSFEVPHDTGMLQASGSVQTELTEPDVVIVGYNKVYAARLHEHPEYHFQKGRKGKYLEDPIKNNLKVFLSHYRDVMSKALS